MKNGVLPHICGRENEIAEAMNPKHGPAFLKETNLKVNELQAVFGIALHMHQPLIPTGPSDNTGQAMLISNLDHMMKHGEEYNASVFADCYGRLGDIIPELVNAGHNPRAMLDYSGELFYGLKLMGRQDILDRNRPIITDPKYRRHAEWLVTMWGHAVASSTPPPDLVLHMRAWQHEFAAEYGLDALTRVRGFSPPEMHMPNHPDVAYEYIKALRDCGFRWLLVQEHTVEPVSGNGFDRHLPHRLIARNSKGEEASIIAIIKTQGSDTKLVAQMQPYYEATGQQRRTINGISIPPIVTQIGDGENGGVMMNEFPPCFRQTSARFGTTGVVSVNGTEYIELIEQLGVTETQLPALRPLHQGRVFNHIKTWEPGAADRAIAEIKKEDGGFNMDGGSWTNNISWVQGYENLLTPMNKLSADFHAALDGRKINTASAEYRDALFHLLAAETSCFRYWGQGVWPEYGREICRRGEMALKKV
jgi:hypothetical protein